MSKASKRLSLLDLNDYHAFYDLPKFNEAEQRYYFTLTPEAQKYIEKLSLASQCYFILQWGYVQAKRRFFTLKEKEAKRDVAFILNAYFPADANTAIESMPSRNTQTTLRKGVLKCLKIKENEKKRDQFLAIKATGLLAYYHRPQDIFRALISMVEKENFLLPDYTIMQDIVSSAINQEESRLSKIIAQQLPVQIREKLSNIIRKTETFYLLTSFKQDLKNFNYQQIMKELEKQKLGKDIYEYSKGFLPTLGLSQHNVHHYGRLALYYSVYKLRRMAEEKAYLYLLCYLYTRHQKISENIAQAFIYKADKYYSECDKEAEKIFLDEKKQLDLDQEKNAQLIGLFDEEDLFKQSFGQVAENQAYKIIPRDMIRKIKQHMMHQEQYRQQLFWQQITKKHATITKNLKPLFCALELSGDLKRNTVLHDALALQALFSKHTTIDNIEEKKLLTKCIPLKTNPYLYENKQLNKKAYEFFLYYRLRDQLASYRIHLNNTLQFKSLTEDIKAVKDWEKDKLKIMDKLNNIKLSDDIEKRLDELIEDLEEWYIIVNENIASGENTYINIKEVNGKKNWTLTYPDDNEELDHTFYRTLPPIDISNVFDFVNNLCQFMDAFTHINGRYQKGERDDSCVKACIIANGTHLGIGQMAMRSNLDLQSLTTQQANYIRLETLQNACQILIDYIQKMVLFGCYNFIENQHHASIDASKHGTKRSTSTARHSPKYFGLEKGIAALNMIFNNLSVNTKIISANEHESHHGIGLAYNGIAGIIPDTISTDTAGANSVNFLLYDLLDIQFAPCYKSLSEKTLRLRGSKPSKHYKDFLIKPSKTLDKKNIVEQWPEMQKILAAFLMKETTQEMIVKKLSSGKQQNALKKAFWEYNNIFFSMYFLRYIDDPMLRRAVRIALNGGERHHKQYNTVTKVGGRKFRGMSDIEMEVWHQCTRLITLVMTCYNMHILSELRDSRLKMGDTKGAKIVEKVSPQGTRNINLGGIYHYDRENSKAIDIAGMVEALSQVLEDLLSRDKRR